MAGRPKGSNNKLPTRSWLFDQLVERNFNALDEFVECYRGAQTETKVRLLSMIFEFLFAKARPEDQKGDAGHTVTPSDLAALARMASEPTDG